MAERWKWVVTAYYGAAAAPPARPGDIAAEILVSSDGERDAERAGWENRSEIDHVDVARCG